MRRLPAYIFLAIFSFQVFPIKEIGKIMFDGLMTEEIHETSGESDQSGSKSKNGIKSINLSNQEWRALHCLYQDKAGETAIQESERLPNNFIPDILTPPPNV